MKKVYSKPPIYHAQDKILMADRCKPLTDAAAQGRIDFHAVARMEYPGKSLRNNELPGLLSLGFWDAPDRQQWGLDPHYNEGIELTYLETGSLIFQADQKYMLKADDMTITRPWQSHALGDPVITPSRLHWIILDVSVRKPHQKWKWPDWFIITPEDLKEMTALLRQNENPVWPAGPDVSRAFKRIAGLIAQSDSSVPMSKLTILINELFLGLYDALKSRTVRLRPELTTSRRTVELFLENINNNLELLSQDWSVKMMADYCDLGVTHFTRLCKTISNLTPMQYLNHQRIYAAEKLIRSRPDISVTEAAFHCGFNSSQYFATVFKQVRGCTPGQLRNSRS